MAIAGKVAITPKGEWNANTAYTKLDLVFYDNASYVAIQPSTGVEPTNESYWMLVVQSAGGADLDGIIDGTIQVGNAKTLDGHGVDYFFPKSGGRISANSTVPLELQATNSTDTLVIPLYNQNGEGIGTIGFREGKPVLRIGNSKWYDMLYSNNVSEFALPISGGGTVDGNITLSTTGTATRALILKNNIREVDLLMYANDGNYALRDVTNSRNIFTATADGTNTFNGTAIGNLPLTGNANTKVKAQNTYSVIMTLESGVNNEVYLGFKDLSNNLGYFGFNGANNPVVLSADVQSTYSLLHTGNKPTGTYTGNGSEASRTINVGGINAGVLVVRNSNYSTLVLDSGAISIDGNGTITGIPYREAHYTNNVLTLATTNAALNQNGTNNTYYV